MAIVFSHRFCDVTSPYVLINENDDDDDGPSCSLPESLVMMILTEMALNKSVVNVTVGFPPQTLQLLTIGQWLVVQQRLDGNLSFYRPWTSYRNGRINKQKLQTYRENTELISQPIEPSIIT